MNNYSLPCARMKLSSPVGDLYLAAGIQGLTDLTLQKERIGEIGKTEQSDVNQAQEILLKVRQQLEEYFAGRRHQFDVPLAPKGTEFQKQVWQALINTQHGETLSYGDIANNIHRPKAVRAVGAANATNRIAVIIPCHRIIGKSGKLTGYAYGLEMKRFLLDLERK